MNGANFPHLQPRAELQRNQRGEIGRQHRGKVAAEFRETTLKINPGGLLDIHGDLKVIIIIN